MDYYVMADVAIEKEMGRRFRELRLRRNITQEELSERAQISLTRIKSLERGKGKLETMVAILRELDALDNLDAFLPDPGISPLQIAKMQGKKRQRASGKAKAESEEHEW
ncbi:MAG TPA: helix-turn-helix transcriptional regulator [Geopsychrobacteraceae bacterium]